MLQVWLPLNGNIKNQGLNQNITVTNSGATVNSSGKLGQCYNFNGSSKIQNTISSAISSNIGSLACWVKFNALPSTSGWFCLMQLGALGGFATCRLGLYFEKATGINISINGSSTGANYQAYTFTTGVWYHICATYDGTKVKLYINGEKKLDKNATVGSYTTAASNLFIGGTNSYFTNGLINDCRYYDHALSEKEVQEIAKGLVVHYKLGQSMILDSFSYDTNIYEEPDGSSWLRIIHHNNPTTSGYFNKTDTWDTGVYLSEDKWFRINVVDKLSSFEFMVKQKTTASATEAKYRWTQTKNPKEAVYNDVKPGTVTFNTSSGYTNSSFGGLWQMNTNARLCIANSNAGNWYGAFGSWTVYQTNKLPGFPNTEITTGYMDLYVRIDGQALFDKVYDCSGYQNNATNVNCTISTDTAKYNASIAQKSGQYIRSLGRPNDFLPHDAITVNLWIKCAAWGNPISCTEGGGFNFEANGNYIQFPIHITHSSGTSYAGARTSITRASLLNDWHMITGVYDGTNTIIYVDGKESGRNTVNYSGVIHYQNNYLFIGAEAQGDNITPADSSYTGNISDVRIYATALSAAAIKDLYETSAEIDKNGNFYIGSINETTNISITKTNIANANDYIEGASVAELTSDAKWNINHVYEI